MNTATIPANTGWYTCTLTTDDAGRLHALQTVPVIAWRVSSATPVAVTIHGDVEPTLLHAPDGFYYTCDGDGLMHESRAINWLLARGEEPAPQ